jgi:hypothetical protein
MVKSATSQTPLNNKKRNTSKAITKQLGWAIKDVNLILPEIDLETVESMNPKYEERIEEMYEEFEIRLEKAKRQEQEIIDNKESCKRYRFYFENFLDGEESAQPDNKEKREFDVKKFSLISIFRSFIRLPEGELGFSIEQKRQGLENYNRIVTARENFRLIARSVGLIGSYDRHLPIKGITTALLDKKGVLHAELDSFSKAINDVDATRIRECLVCERIFWAGKRNQKSCSNRCANNYRQRKWQEKWQEKYKPQRYKKAEQQAKKSELQE